MTPIEQKALALVNEIAKDRGTSYPLVDRKNDSRWEALCRAIEREQAFRQEVSDAVERYWSCGATPPPYMARFIVAKPDPLVEALAECEFTYLKDSGERLRAALKARGLKIVETTDE